ncbi:hypothetical protein DFH09DRAFT_1272284 [Mycena vulgaris]|nr:hypothetical protein DFH09DRAFT_1272284 [Mycena vulgaris]
MPSEEEARRRIARSIGVGEGPKNGLSTAEGGKLARGFSWEESVAENIQDKELWSFDLDRERTSDTSRDNWQVMNASRGGTADLVETELRNNKILNSVSSQMSSQNLCNNATARSRRYLVWLRITFSVGFRVVLVTLPEIYSASD